MPYNLQQQLSSDLDIFLFDNRKIIHIATAGGILPDKIANTEINFQDELYQVNQYRRIFSRSVIENLERDNLTERSQYIDFFMRMSKRGFYSYDKLDINNPEDQTYQLISYPTYDRNLIINSYNFTIEADLRLKYDLSVNINLIQTREIFPVDFRPFNLVDFV